MENDGPRHTVDLKIDYAAGTKQFVELATEVTRAVAVARQKHAELGAELDRAKVALLALSEQIVGSHVVVETGEELAPGEAHAEGADRAGR